MNARLAMLANTKTRRETGLEDLLTQIQPRTPYGLELKKGLRPFWPGQEEALEETFDHLETLLAFLEEASQASEEAAGYLAHLKEIRTTLARSADQVLTLVELFDLKSFLLNTAGLRSLLEEQLQPLPGVYALEDTDDLLDLLDPSGQRIDTFYIYDAFSPRLAQLRRESRDLEREERAVQKRLQQEVLSAWGLRMNPAGQLVISKADGRSRDLADGLVELVLLDEDYTSYIYGMAPTPETDALRREKEALEQAIEEEEEQVRRQLSSQVQARAEALLGNCAAVGRLDLDLAKAAFARKHACVRPRLYREHRLDISGGRNLVVQEILSRRGKPYCPVDISLEAGVTAITGANMGGKTITLKMVGQVALLAQYGFFVPCRRAGLGLSSYLHLLVGDGQNLQRGLSSFGSEMEELREVLDRAKERSLLLIDELASGTNPVEGQALTRSFVDYFKERPYLTLMTTHFDYAASGDRIKNLRVRGLDGVDFHRLHRELAHANRKERIDIIASHTDYRLTEAGGGQVPRDALNIAKMLGIYDEIIDGARDYVYNSKATACNENDLE